jgi:GNAT superfamily N-acetyltransferase
LTYDVVGGDCEVLTLHVAQQWAGVGTLLISEVARIAVGLGCSRYWVVTTNDNIDAFRFYQRRGFCLAAVRCGAVEEARRSLKPNIPWIGNYGIPLRDEIELTQQLPPPDAPA